MFPFSALINDLGEIQIDEDKIKLFGKGTLG